MATPESELSLRERKKRATRAALQRAALELVAAHGLEGVTIDDITARVGVSPRTFFNYFATKEESLIDADPDRLDRFVANLRSRPADEPPLISMRELLIADAPRIAQAQELWRLRMALGAKHPEIFHAAASATAHFDAAIASVIAERSGTDLATDPLPRLVSGVSSAARRAALNIWARGDFQQPYPRVLAGCFEQLSTLLPDAAG